MMIAVALGVSIATGADPFMVMEGVPVASFDSIPPSPLLGQEPTLAEGAVSEAPSLIGGDAELHKSIGSMIEIDSTPQPGFGPVVTTANEGPVSFAQPPGNDSPGNDSTGNDSNQATPAPTAETRRPIMFLSRQSAMLRFGQADPDAIASPSDSPETESDAGSTGDGRFVQQATPYRAASVPLQAENPNGPFERLPHPAGRLPIDGQRRTGDELWDSNAESLGDGSFMERLRDPVAGDELPFDMSVLDRGILDNDPSYGIYESDGPDSLWSPRGLATDLSEDLRQSRALSRRAAGRVSAFFNRGFDSVMATRQRVDSGLGLLMVANAPIVLDTTQPMQQVRFRTDFGFGLGYPDRSEYFWAAPGRGPGYQGEIDYREFAFMFEVGGDAFSVQTEIPIRGYSPEFGDGHTAVGDIRITQKTRIVNGNDFQLTQMLRVHTPTGNVKAGAGTGHTSMEPGVLMRYRYNDWTYLHSELKYWIPMGGNPDFSGDVLTYGFGVSTVWYESLTRAVIPTLELSSLNFLTGGKTGTFGPERVSRDATAALHPGVRFAWDPGGDLGITELGVSAGMAISRDPYHDSLLRFELRFTR